MGAILQAPAKGRSKPDSGNGKAKKSKAQGKSKEEKGSDKKVPSAARNLVNEEPQSKGFGNGSNNRGEGSPSTSGTVTSSRSTANTNTVSSGIKLEKVMSQNLGSAWIQSHNHSMNYNLSMNLERGVLIN